MDSLLDGFELTPDNINTIFTGFVAGITGVNNSLTAEDIDSAWQIIEEETKDIPHYTEYLSKKSDYPDLFSDWKFGETSEYFIPAGENNQIPPNIDEFRQVHCYAWIQEDLFIQNEILRNSRGRECTLVQVQIAKAFLLMLFSMVENKLSSYEIIEVPSSKVTTRSLTAEELQESSKRFKKHYDKCDRDRDFRNGKINEHDEYYNEGDK